MRFRTENIFFQIYLPRILGGSFIILALFVAISLLSYHVSDPSLNRASGAEVQNWGGSVGAFIADPLLQFLGIASSILSFAFLLWGIRLIRELKIPYFLLRMATLLIALATGATLSSFIAAVEWWPFDIDSLGGFIGRFTKDEMSFMFGTPVVLGVAMLMFSVSLYVGLGLSFGEWKTVFRYIYRGMVITKACIVWTARFVWKIKTKLQSRNNGDEPFIAIEGVPEAVVPEPKKLIEFSLPRKKRAQASQPTRQAMLKLSAEDYELPSMSLLAKTSSKKKESVNESALAQNARLLENVLSDFGVMGKIVKVRPGPVVTLYELEPAAGTKSSRVIGLADDIARSMSALSARIAVIPGRNAIGIELPNTTRETVFLRELLETDEYKDEGMKLPIALGKDIGGEAMIVDLSRMPHLLVAGTTGSGKSVAVNAMILSFLYRLTPQECKFIMIDPKMLELSVYDGIPHLLCPVVTEPGKAVVALKWAVKEMENRYRLMSNLGVRNVAGYNKKIKEAMSNGEVLERTVQTGFEPDTGRPIFEKQPLEMTPLPFIVVIVDEMADLMLVAGKDIEASIQRLAQMARAAGIHLIMATQRPSVDVITGVIKANFPTRISFQVTSRIDSRTILGEQGAEQLLGMGDMLYMAGGGRITRSHGPFVDDKEVEKIVDYLKTQGTPNYIEEVTEESDDGGMMAFGDEGGEADLYKQAVTIVCRDKKASTSYIQRCLKIGYNRAATIIEQMERDGVVSAANHVGRREVLIKYPEELHA